MGSHWDGVSSAVGECNPHLDYWQDWVDDGSLDGDLSPRYVEKIRRYSEIEVIGLGDRLGVRKKNE